MTRVVRVFVFNSTAGVTSLIVLITGCNPWSVFMPVNDIDNDDNVDDGR